MIPPFLRQTGLRLLHAWLPRRCLLCSASAGRQALCLPCHLALPHLRHACRQCALPLDASADGLLCGDCLDTPPGFESAVCAVHYRPPADWLIRQFKYHGRPACAGPLASLLLAALQSHYRDAPWPGLILPVPLHPTRLAERGYNQSLLLAERLARATGIPLARDGCLRLRPTPSQSGLDRSERRRNLKNAFRVLADVRGQRVAIVDDVLTTGVTGDMLARALRRAGAREVHLWCVARTPPPSH